MFSPAASARVANVWRICFGGRYERPENRSRCRNFFLMKASENGRAALDRLVDGGRFEIRLAVQQLRYPYAVHLHQSAANGVDRVTEFPKAFESNLVSFLLFSALHNLLQFTIFEHHRFSRSALCKELMFHRFPALLSSPNP